MPFLAFDLLFDAAIEEKGEVRVFLRLCMTSATCTEDTRETYAYPYVSLLHSAGHLLRRNSDREREFSIVARHRSDVLRKIFSAG